MRQQLHDFPDSEHVTPPLPRASRPPAATTRRKSSGSLGRSVAIFSHVLWGIAGTPDHARFSFAESETATPVFAPSITPSPTSRCPASPDCPPIITRFPIRALPAIPTWAAITVSRPISTLCPTWIRLSSLVPGPTRVTPSAARSIVVFAPISTSSPISTVPTCGIFRYPCGVGANPKPSLPITQPACRSTRFPTRTPS